MFANLDTIITFFYDLGTETGVLVAFFILVVFLFYKIFLPLQGN